MEAQINHWYLLFCKPQQHLRAAWQLGNQDFTCFNPMRPVQKTVRRVTKVVDEPLFPNYLFIQLNELSNWKALRSTRGVSRIVSFNGEPAIVEDEIIHALQIQCDKSYTQAPKALYNPGDRVIITEGCFNNIEAIVKASKAEDRILLLLQLLNGIQTIELPLAHIARA